MTPEGFPGNATPRRSRRARLAMILGGLGMVAVCLVIRYFWGAGSAKAAAPWANVLSRPANAPETVPAPAPTRSGASAGGAAIPEIVATVNGRQISREELGRECLDRYGKEILEAMINRHLIYLECGQRGVTVSRAEVDAEIERMARRFKIPVDQWLKLLKQERGIKPEQYAADIVWPTLALRKLAGSSVAVTPEETHKAFEAEYGPAVRARLITCGTLEKAQKVRAMAAAKPGDFPNLAKDQSEDAPSAALLGLIQPIRKHCAHKPIEDAVFAMADGEISPVIAVGGQFVILKREELLPAREVKLEQVAAQLEEVIRERKMRGAAGQIFAELQKRSVVVRVFTDPEKGRQMPGVAAVINGSQIPLRQLAEECIIRHGQEVLEGTINRRLIESACQRQGVAVTDKDLDDEIARAAGMMVKRLPNGQPDVAAWLKLVTERQGIPVALYRRDVVWPSMALKKLTGAEVQVTDEDLRKAFEANYGPRVRCRAIILDDLRQATRVWQDARAKPTVENFGQLARKHSIEANSRSLDGQVPPISRYGSQPLLEDEAFKLRPGELSGVIQAEDKYVILFCEGLTKPVEVNFADVRAMLFEDIREKKQRLAMAEYFERLLDNATIDNFLAHTSKSPVRAASRDAAAGKPAPREGSLRVPLVRPGAAGG